MKPLARLVLLHTATHLLKPFREGSSRAFKLQYNKRKSPHKHLKFKKARQVMTSIWKVLMEHHTALCWAWCFYHTPREPGKKESW